MYTKPRLTRFIAALAASLTFGCGAGDSGSATPSDNSVADGATANASVSDAGTVVSNSAAADAGEDERPDTGATEPDAGESDAEPRGPTPVEVAWPATVDDFVASATHVSYISALDLPKADASGYPTCCRDFGAISKRPGPDNALGTLLEQVTALNPAAGAEDLLQTSVKEGRIVLLLDHRAYEGAQDSDGYALSWIDGQWNANTTWNEALDGGGTFLVDRESFIPGSGQPKAVMNPALIEEGRAFAGPTTLRIEVPVGFALVPVTVHDARVEGMIRAGEAGVSYSEGELSGYATTSSIFDALNEIVGANCGCLGLDDPFRLYSQSPTGNWGGSCAPMAHLNCSEPDQEVCRVLAGANVIDGGFCGVLPQILQNSADIDSDGDGQWESISIGLEWSAVPAALE